MYIGASSLTAHASLGLRKLHPVEVDATRPRKAMELETDNARRIPIFMT
jgi:hypothetical protein